MATVKQIREYCTFSTYSTYSTYSWRSRHSYSLVWFPDPSCRCRKGLGTKLSYSHRLSHASFAKRRGLYMYLQRPAGLEISSSMYFQALRRLQKDVEVINVSRKGREEEEEEKQDKEEESPGFASQQKRKKQPSSNLFALVCLSNHIWKQF